MQLTKINGKYELWLPEHRAARPEWKIENGGWEVQRIEAMIQVIAEFQKRKQRQPIVFDIGTEEGDISALLVKYTKCDIVLVEPNIRAWPCIRYIWEANKLDPPFDSVNGFFSNENNGLPIKYIFYDVDVNDIIPDHGFKQLYEQDREIPQWTMDNYASITGFRPDIITMDVEGSEWEVMKGAERLLLEKKPTIFMSVHPVFMKEHYNQEVGEMLRWMHDRGYKHSVIELDYHELHVLFEPK